MSRIFLLFGYEEKLIILNINEANKYKYFLKKTAVLSLFFFKLIYKVTFRKLLK